jgi:pyruvate dehydrogenase E2 component (dihydrolipoamide acetyltransferase)
MATAVIMPRQGQSVESCIIGMWHKKVGDRVLVGDELFTYETDKAAFDEEAHVAGEVLAIFYADGDDVPCLTTICVIGEKGEDISAFLPQEAVRAAPAVAESSARAAVAGSSAGSFPPREPAAAGEIADASPATHLAISPRAKALAAKHHADLRAAVASGPKGRVIERDVRSLIDDRHFATGAAGSDYRSDLVGTGIGGRISVDDVEKSALASSTPAPRRAGEAAPARFYEEKHSNIRKLIAKSMTQSLSSMAQLTYTTSFDATAIIDFRAKMKQASERASADQPGLAESAITINDIILFAVSRVVKDHRVCNASWLEDRMVYYTDVNLGMAVDTPRGLMVPTIFGADALSLAEISRTAKRLAADCQKGTISPDFLKDATITVSNLGGLGIESFTPVVNPPQTSILGVNRIATAVRDENGVAVPYASISLSLTCDHRAVDGAPAARFLRDLTSALEHFSLLLVK